MTRPAATPRPGFTLVELLVAMAVIVALAAIALVVVPEVMTQDRTTDGAGTVRQTLMIAEARARRDGAPRGVRFLVGADPTNPSKTDPRWVTELQFVEQPPPLVPGAGEQIEVEFTLDNAQALVSPPGVYYMNASNEIRDFINNQFDPPPTGAGRDSVELRMYRNDELIVLTIAGKLTTPIAADPMDARRTVRVGPSNYELTIDWNRSTVGPLMTTTGAGQVFAMNNFWLNRPPEPLLGEQTVPLPRNVCVDLSVSAPPDTPLPGVVTTGAATDVDVMFRPNGQAEVPGNSAQAFFWIRDYTKINTSTRKAVDRSNSTPPVYDLAPFQQGGEQQIVSLRTRSGSLAVFPVQWPQDNGTYPLVSPGAYDDPFGFARKAAP